MSLWQHFGSCRDHFLLRRPCSSIGICRRVAVSTPSRSNPCGHNSGAAFNKQRSRHSRCCAASEKQIWIETTSKGAFTSALEAGASTFLFQQGNESLADEWRNLAKFRAIYCGQPGKNEYGAAEAVSIVRVDSREDLEKAEAHQHALGTVIMDASDWQIIPAENLVAAFQGQPATLFGVAKTARDARILLEALEIGTDGVVLRTDDAAEVREAMQYVKETSQLASQTLGLAPATVTRIEQLGMGDRVAVDLCSMMVPGEGLLVGSFARGLFLVHSECSESLYINSRPFRVNCGPVHSYVAMPGGKTAYLSELKSGMEVLVIDSQGRQRVAIVGRAKIEMRPLVLVEANIGEETYGIILQNAETVRLVCPSEHDVQPGLGEKAGETASKSVTELQEGTQVLLHQQEGARHTGMAIKEALLEK